jgi:hypothetical protein
MAVCVSIKNSDPQMTRVIQEINSVRGAVSSELYLSTLGSNEDSTTIAASIHTS